MTLSNNPVVSDIHTYPDLVIYACIPNCNKCPKFWINKLLGHRIVCKCRKCQHGETAIAYTNHPALGGTK